MTPRASEPSRCPRCGGDHHLAVCDAVLFKPLHDAPPQRVDPHDDDMDQFEGAGSGRVERSGDSRDSAVGLGSVDPTTHPRLGNGSDSPESADKDARQNVEPSASLRDTIAAKMRILCGLGHNDRVCIPHAVTVAVEMVEKERHALAERKVMHESAEREANQLRVAVAERGHVAGCDCHRDGDWRMGDCYDVSTPEGIKKHAHPYTDPRCTPGGEMK